MSDNAGDRPEDQVPAPEPQDSPNRPTAADSTPTAAQPPVPPAPPAGWQAPRPPYPAVPPQQAYGVPPRTGYAGQPVGAAFGGGAPSQPTQPTLPLASDTAANSTPASRRGGAGKVVGLIVAAALVGGAAGLGGAYAGLSLWGDDDAGPVAGPSTITVNNPDEVTATTAVAAKVLPSVVTIKATSGSGGGTGSGVILSEDGYVVTNTHVVTLDGQTADATVSATTSDGRVFDAEIIGTDPLYDLAVIKLTDASGLTPIEFADSDDLNVGDATVAVGAPLGLSNTVTTGIVSALHRSISVASAAAPDDGGAEPAPEGQQDSPFFFDFGEGQRPQSTNERISISVIQTDAAINPGNSGGALVDSDGRLIGVNVAIASAGGTGGQPGNIGVGFAIPSVIAQRVAEEIIENGSATHGLLGATVQPTSTVADADIAGAYIAELTSGGAADEAGLRAGDIVTEFDGKPITNSIDLTAQVRALPAGATVELTYVRGGDSRTVEVTLGELGA